MLTLWLTPANRGCKAEYYLLDSDPLLQEEEEEEEEEEEGAPLQKHTKTWVTFWKLVPC